MKAELKLECKNCIDDLVIEIDSLGKELPTMKQIREEASKQGWTIGRDCYCPDCFLELPAHCSSCEDFEGNKSMGASVCRRDSKFTTANDYCKYHRCFYGHNEKEILK